LSTVTPNPRLCTPGATENTTINIMEVNKEKTKNGIQTVKQRKKNLTSYSFSHGEGVSFVDDVNTTSSFPNMANRVNHSVAAEN